MPEVNSELEAIFARAEAEFQTKQQANKAWGLGQSDRWDADLNTGELRFTFKSGLIVTAPVQVIGSFDLDDETWHWSWDNPSVNRLLTQDAQRCREFGERYGLADYTKPLFECALGHAVGFASLAMHLAGSAGCYQGDAGSLVVFLNFGPVTQHRLS